MSFYVKKLVQTDDFAECVVDRWVCTYILYTVFGKNILKSNGFIK